MRVISMVPSWTETLIEAGVNVVGRTRFCIHPKMLIPVVGGTKDWDLKKIAALNPDLIILDKEENPISMSLEAEFPYFATHVSSVLDMPRELNSLGAKLNNSVLLQYAEAWEKVPLFKRPLDLDNFPGIVEWGLKPQTKITKVIYVIWKNPWMSVSRDTFIGSMLELCGMQALIPQYDEKYPVIDLVNMPDKKSTLLLFSSEPYHFLKNKDGLKELGFPHAYVNGESFSWFGVRSLRFLIN